MYVFSPKQVKHLQYGVRGVLAFGVVTSVAANVVNKLLHWAPIEGQSRLSVAIALAALAPLLLFLGIEMVSRIPIHSRVLGTVRLVATSAVAAGAAWISYWHMVSVATALHETDSGAQYIYPIIIDGTMAVATISGLELGRLARSVQQVIEVEERAVAAVAATAKLTAEEKAAKKDRDARRRKAAKAAGYDEMTPAEKAAFTYQWNKDEDARLARLARRTTAVAPVSPGQPPVAAPSVEQLVEAVR